MALQRNTGAIAACTTSATTTPTLTRFARTHPMNHSGRNDVYRVRLRLLQDADHLHEESGSFCFLFFLTPLTLKEVTVQTQRGWAFRDVSWARRIKLLLASTICWHEAVRGMWQGKSQWGLKQEVKVHTYGKTRFQNGVPVKDIGSKTADQDMPCEPHLKDCVARHPGQASSKRRWTPERSVFEWRVADLRPKSFFFPCLLSQDAQKVKGCYGAAFAKHFKMSYFKKNMCHLTVYVMTLTMQLKEAVCT